MTKNNSSIRLTDEFLSFSEKLQTNRVKAEVDKKTIGHPRISKLIVKYFKNNNDRYLELVKMEEENGF